tara:strand:+ start:1154 stop:1273 length:120 start_codon:yes stop_codon:yes gene_type:complete
VEQPEKRPKNTKKTKKTLLLSILYINAKEKNKGDARGER